MNDLTIKFRYLMITLLLMMLTVDYKYVTTEEVGFQPREIFTEKIGLKFENHPIDFN